MSLETKRAVNARGFRKKRNAQNGFGQNLHAPNHISQKTEGHFVRQLYFQVFKRASAINPKKARCVSKQSGMAQQMDIERILKWNIICQKDKIATVIFYCGFKDTTFDTMTGWPTANHQLATGRGFVGWRMDCANHNVLGFLQHLCFPQATTTMTPRKPQALRRQKRRQSHIRAPLGHTPNQPVHHQQCLRLCQPP